MRNFKYLLLSAAFFAAPALADEVDVVTTPQARDNDITVVATGIRVPLSQTGQSISVIGDQEIASIQGPDVTRVLERSAGVTLSRNGGVGGFTSLRVRGAEGEQLLVLVDGVRVADVAAPGGGYDFGNLLPGTIGKIELLRGSNSVVWGSRAIGGVLAVTSRAPEGVEASAEYGANDSIYGTVSAGMATERFSASVNAGFQDSDGVSTAAVGSEPDGFRQWSLAGRARLAVTDGLALTANARYVDGKLDIDGFPPPFYSFADTAERQDTREWSGRVGAEYTTDALTLTAGYTLADTRRKLFDPAIGPDSYFTTKGREERAELRGRYGLGGGLELNFGAEHEWSNFSTGPSFGISGKARQTSGHALLAWSDDRLSLAAGARIDDHNRFGSQWSLGANGSFRVTGDWRIRASYGEGFKAPTLYQLLSDYGNLDLDPERSRSYDLGIEKGDRNGPLHVALTAFRRDSRNLIDFFSCWGVTSDKCDAQPDGYYFNVGRARAQGIELELNAQVSERVRAGSAYTYLDTENRTPDGLNEGNDLARRPRHAVTVWADWRSPLYDLTLGGDIRMVGDAFDNAGNTGRLDGYALVTLRASVPVTEQVELFGRVENLFDEQYETARGYGTYGRSAYVGARARF